MTKCGTCGEGIKSLPFKCKRCGENFCVEHRLPELHDCPNMPYWWHSRGRNVIPASQLVSTKVICHTPLSSEEDCIPAVLTP